MGPEVPGPSIKQYRNQAEVIRRFAVSTLLGGETNANQELSKSFTQSTLPALKCFHLLCGGIHDVVDSRLLDERVLDANEPLLMHNLSRNLTGVTPNCQ